VLVLYISRRLSLPPREEHRARYFVFIHMTKTRGVYFSKFDENVIKIVVSIVSLKTVTFFGEPGCLDSEAIPVTSSSSLITFSRSSRTTSLKPVLLGIDLVLRGIVPCVGLMLPP